MPETRTVTRERLRETAFWTLRAARYGVQLAALPVGILVAAVVGASLAWPLTSAESELIAPVLHLLAIEGGASEQSRLSGELARHGGGILGLAILIPLFRYAAESALPAAFDYVRRPSFRHLIQIAGVAGLASWSAALVAPAVTGEPSGTRNQPDPIPMLVSVPAPTPVASVADPLATFYVTWSEDANITAVDAGHGPGLDLTPSYEEQIDILALGLRACEGADGEPVAVTVVGMASSSPFEGLSPEASRPRNRELANLRARAVADRLRAAGGPIEVEVAEWRSYEHMVAFRGFWDRTATGDYDERKALLTRRAEVHLMSAPGCEIGAPLGLTGPRGPAAQYPATNDHPAPSRPREVAAVDPTLRPTS